MSWELTEYAGPGPLASGTVRSDMVRRDGKAPEFASQAFRGESTDSGFDVDDDDAAYEPPIIKQWALTEDASGAAVVIWRGRLIRHLTRRGDHAIGDARLYEATLNDVNWELRKLRVHGWDRPAETDVARAQALGAYILNGSASTVTNARKRPSTVIDVTTYVPNTNTVDLPAKTYDGTDPWGVLDDIAAASGKEWFVYCADDGSAKLFYDLDTSMALVSPLTITDLDPDLITEFPPETPATTGDRDGSEFLSGGAHLYGDGGIVTHFNATAETDYDVVEDTLYDSAESEADAAARLEKLIDERDQPEPRIETAVWLPPGKVHQAKAGMMIGIRSGDAGLTSLTTLRIRRAAATPPLGAADGFWHLQLELAYPKKERPRLRDRGRIQVLARQAASTPPTEADATFTAGSNLPTDHWFAKIDEGSDPTAWDHDIAKAGWIPGFILGTGFAEEINASFAQCFPDNDAVRNRTRGFLQVVASTVGVTRPADAVYVKLVFTLQVYEGGFVDPGEGMRAMGGFHRNPVASDVQQMTGPYELLILPGGAAPAAGDVLVGQSYGSIGNISSTPHAFEIDVPIASVAWEDANGIRFMFGPLFDAPGGWACWADINDGHVVGGHARITGTAARIVTVATPGWINGFPEGTQDGASTVFTLPGGTLEEVQELYVNGIAVPPTSYDVDTGAGELTTLGWAPAATDLLSARYRVS